jgi:hypothetical protein
MRIRIHIESVVLDGVPVKHPRLLRRTLEEELGRQLRHGGLSPEFQKGGAVPAVGGGEIKIGPGQPAAKLGTQIARAVYGGIGGGR